MSCRIYQSPGRIRVRLSSLKAAIPCGLVSELQKLRGVRSVLASELTGSIVIYYDNDVRCSRSLLRTFRKYGLLQNVIGFPHEPTAHVVRSKMESDQQNSIIVLMQNFLRRALKTRPLA